MKFVFSLTSAAAFVVAAVSAAPLNDNPGSVEISNQVFAESMSSLERSVFQMTSPGGDNINLKMQGVASTVMVNEEGLSFAAISSLANQIPSNKLGEQSSSFSYNYAAWVDAMTAKYAPANTPDVDSELTKLFANLRRVRRDRTDMVNDVYDLLRRRYPRDVFITDAMVEEYIRRDMAYEYNVFANRLKEAQAKLEDFYRKHFTPQGRDFRNHQTLTTILKDNELAHPFKVYNDADKSHLPSFTSHNMASVVQAVKRGEGTSMRMTVTSNEIRERVKEWTAETRVSVPFFHAVKANQDGKKINFKSKDFSLNVTVTSLGTAELAPGPWYQPGMIATYCNKDQTVVNEPTKNFFGKDGILSHVPIRAVFAKGLHITASMSRSALDELIVNTQWMAGVRLGFWGLRLETEGEIKYTSRDKDEDLATFSVYTNATEPIHLGTFGALLCAHNL